VERQTANGQQTVRRRWKRADGRGGGHAECPPRRGQACPVAYWRSSTFLKARRARKENLRSMEQCLRAKAGKHRLLARALFHDCSRAPSRGQLHHGAHRAAGPQRIPQHTHADGSTASHDGITATRSGVLSSGILAFCPRFRENRFVGRNSAVLSLRAEGQRVEEPKGPRVKASQAGVRGDKMRWVLSIMSWSAMQVRSRQLAADHRRDGARLRWPQIGGRIATR